jgi:sterol desaturase/sphingolipid hydroxylase (fatty acid hydroxylase superfamily)
MVSVFLEFNLWSGQVKHVANTHLMKNITWVPLCLLMSSPLVCCYSHIISNFRKDKNVMSNKKVNHALRHLLPLYGYISWCALSFLCSHQKRVTVCLAHFLTFFFRKQIHLNQGFSNPRSQLKFLHAGSPFLTRTPEL